MSVFDEFEWRGMIYDATEGLPQIFSENRIRAYIGFDPSASSLHVGSLLPIMGLVHLQRHGHTPIALAGGGTGRIGDPSGKAEERPLMTEEEVDANLVGIKEQLAHFLDFSAKSNPAIMVNNADWLCTVNMVEFLRDVGKFFSVNYMIGKESVRRRLEQEEGISFTEFSYLLLQAYDFLQLYDRYNCILQMGGSDQWGNITAGIDLIRRVRGGKAYGLVFPLLTTANGSKFGKTELGTVWLDAKLTSPYRYYQFWLNTSDEDVIPYLKFFTLLSQAEIKELEGLLSSRPEERDAQRRLAREATRLTHGDDALNKAERASRILFGEEIHNLSAEDIFDIFADAPSCGLSKSQFSDTGTSVVDLLVSSGLTKSKGEARRLIQGGGIYLNNIRVTDEKLSITLNDSIEGQALVLRRGAKEYRLILIR